MKSERQLRQVLIRSTGISLCDIAAVFFFCFVFFRPTVDKQQHARTRGRRALCKETPPSWAAHVIICFLNRLNGLFSVLGLCVYCVWQKVAQKKYEAQQHSSSVTFCFSAACFPRQSEFLRSRTRQKLFFFTLRLLSACHSAITSSFIFQNNRNF